MSPKIAILTWAACLFSAAASVASAQAAERLAAAAPSAQTKTVAFKIPAQPLADALIAFSRQSGLQVSYQPELAAGKSAAPVSGNHSPEAALKLLLGNTGLTYRFTEANTATLERVAAQTPAATRAKPVAAQEPAAQPTITLPQVTVQDAAEKYSASSATTATKIDAPLMDIPQSIQVVPRQVIEDQRAVNLSDVLRNVSGFSPSVNSQSQRFGERDAIFRGFAGNNYYTNGFKDPFNGSSFSAGLANIDRVEVLKGPASVLYGLGDPNATVNILTKQPLTEWYASGEITGARFGLANPSVDVSGPLTSSKDLRFRFNAGYQYQDSFVDYVKSQRYLVAPVLAWSIGPNTLFTAEGEYQEIGEIYYTGLPGQGTISPNINGKIPRSRYLGDKKLEGDDFPERRQGKLGYRLDHRFNEHVSLRHGFRTTLFNVNERDVIPSLLDVDERTMFRSLFAAKTSRHDYYALTDLNFDFKTGPIGHKFLIGSDQRFNSVRSRTANVELEDHPIDIFNPVYGNIPDPITPDTPRNLTSGKGTFIGVYLQDLIAITDQIKFLAGVRYDNAYQRSTFRVTDSDETTRSKLDENVFTPRAGLVYQPFPWMAIYGSYSKSFVPLEGVNRAGSALKPETGEQWEGGVKFDFFDGRITSTLAGYQLTKQNVAAPDPDFPEFTVQIGEQRSRGFEFDLSGEVLTGLRLIGSYAYTDAKILKSTPLFEIDVAGNRRANVPKHSGSLWGVYQFQEGTPLKGLSVGLGLIGVGQRPSDDFASDPLPGYVRTDAALRYRFSKHLDVGLNVKNLFNKKYFETSTFGVWENGISPGAPFTAFGTIRVRY